MRNWKLPRKQKKVFLARYGRAAYRMFSSGWKLKADCVYTVRHGARRLDIAIDPFGPHPVAVISEQVGEVLHMLGWVRLGPGTDRHRESGRELVIRFDPELLAKGLYEMSAVPRKDVAMPAGAFDYLMPMRDIRPSRDPNPPYGLHDQLLEARQALRDANAAGDVLRVMELKQHIIGRIEREITRSTSTTKSSAYILIDKLPVAVTDILCHALWMQVHERHVQYTELPGAVTISTAFLGLDFGFAGERAFFETMVFGGVHGGEQERYATWAEAEAGHQRWVERHFEA